MGSFPGRTGRRAWAGKGRSLEGFRGWGCAELTAVLHSAPPSLPHKARPHLSFLGGSSGRLSCLGASGGAPLRNP